LAPVRLGKLDAELLQPAGDLVVDVLRAVVGWKPLIVKGKPSSMALITGTR
jgi:hypothetical protein